MESYRAIAQEKINNANDLRDYYSMLSSIHTEVAKKHSLLAESTKREADQIQVSLDKNTEATFTFM
jgi:hypothetical protein